MLKKSFLYMLVAMTVTASPAIQAHAMSGALTAKASCRTASGETGRDACPAPSAKLLLIRDARAAQSGSGGGASSCWSACFNDYNLCMDHGPKNVCVSRMKTCMAICDRLSNRPDM